MAILATAMMVSTVVSSAAVRASVHHFARVPLCGKIHLLHPTDESSNGRLLMDEQERIRELIGHSYQTVGALRESMEELYRSFHSIRVMSYVMMKAVRAIEDQHVMMQAIKILEEEYNDDEFQMMLSSIDSVAIKILDQYITEDVDGSAGMLDYIKQCNRIIDEVSSIQSDKLMEQLDQFAGK